MKVFTSILLGAGLATAVPTSLTTPSSVLTKRISDQSNCGLDMYQDIDEGQFRIGVRTLVRYDGYDDRDPDWQDVIIANTGKCRLVWCNGNTGIKLCVDPNDQVKKIVFDPVDIGREIDNTFRDCYGREPKGKKGHTLRALQFWGDGYNILAHGNMDCGMRNKDF